MGFEGLGFVALRVYKLTPPYKMSPKAASKTYFLDASGDVLGGSGGDLGRVWGGSGEDLGELWRLFATFWGHFGRTFCALRSRLWHVRV